MNGNNVILSVSYDPCIAGSRSAVLQAAGYSVAEARSLPEAVDLLVTRHFDLVIVGHTVPEADRRGLVAQIRIGKGNLRHDTPVLFLYAHATIPGGADAAVHVLDGPDRWLQVVENLVLKSRFSLAG